MFDVVSDCRLSSMRCKLKAAPPTVIESLKSSRTASASESLYVRKRISRLGVLVSIGESQQLE